MKKHDRHQPTPEEVRRVWRLLGIASAAAIAILVYAWYTNTHQPLLLGCENRGVSLQYVVTRHPHPALARSEIVVRDHWRSFPLRALGQLTGLVHIDTPSMALRYVRLRTCPAFLTTWPRPHEIEIMTFSDAESLYNYGQFQPLAHYGFMINPPELTPVELGLSPRNVKAGGFAPPEITTTSSGYTITRWIYTQDRSLPAEDPSANAWPYRNNIHVEKIREDVGRDGAYQRTVLERKTPPLLPGVYWFIERGGGAE
jgi:hypothetical protein